jgi:hypothetical protein
MWKCKRGKENPVSRSEVLKNGGMQLYPRPFVGRKNKVKMQFLRNKIDEDRHKWIQCVDRIGRIPRFKKTLESMD